MIQSIAGACFKIRHRYTESKSTREDVPGKLQPRVSCIACAHGRQSRLQGAGEPVRGLFQNDKGVDALERATLNANALNNRTSRNMEFENSLNFMKVKTHRI